MSKYYLVTEGQTVHDALTRGHCHYVGTNYTYAAEAAEDGNHIYELEIRHVGVAKIKTEIVLDPEYGG